MAKTPVKDSAHYSKNTPPKIVSILEAARSSDRGYRLRIHYGDPATGKPCGDMINGYIGRCAGRTKIPLILSRRTSIVGKPILLSKIVKIEHACRKNGGVLFNITPEVCPQDAQKVRKS